MYSLATIQFVDRYRQTDRRTDDSSLPIAEYTVLQYDRLKTKISLRLIVE